MKTNGKTQGRLSTFSSGPDNKKEEFVIIAKLSPTYSLLIFRSRSSSLFLDLNYSWFTQQCFTHFTLQKLDYVPQSLDHGHANSINSTSTLVQLFKNTVQSTKPLSIIWRGFRYSMCLQYCKYLQFKIPSLSISKYSHKMDATAFCTLLLR